MTSLGVEKYIKISTRNPKMPVGLPEHIREDNIKMDRKHVWCKYVNWINVTRVSALW